MIHLLKNLLEPITTFRLKQKSKLGIETETIFPGLSKLEHFTLEIYKVNLSAWLQQEAGTPIIAVFDNSILQAEGLLTKIQERQEGVIKEISDLANIEKPGLIKA